MTPLRAAIAAFQAAETTTAGPVQAAVAHLRNARQVWCTGIGKSGLVARKVAGSLSTLGHAAAFLHPVEALHGDAGAVRPADVLVAVSQSGHTAEVLRLVRELALPTVALCKVPSPLAALAQVALDTTVPHEAGGALPVTSFVLAATLGDTLALALGGRVNHPGGFLGAMERPVRELMRPPPLVAAATPALATIPLLGDGAVLLHEGGIFTDGDLRRAAGRGELDRPVGELATRTPVTVAADAPARLALDLLERRTSQLSVLPVVEEGRYVGLLRLHDLVRAGLGA